jgi:hypothetical protein
MSSNNNNNIDVRSMYKVYSKVINGKLRTIYSPNAELLALQNQHAEQLVDYITQSDLCFSYVKGLANPCQKMLEYHYGGCYTEYGNVYGLDLARQVYSIKFDITNFFRSTRQSTVFNMLFGSFGSFGKFGYRQAGLISELTCYDGRLAFGSSLSPIISNGILNAIDHELEDYALWNSCKYSRYCDDMLITGYSLNSVTQGYLLASRLLYMSGYKVNPAKTELNPNTVLGINIEEMLCQK